MVANPYSSALQGLSGQRSGAKKGLDLIYKAMRQNITEFGKRMGTLDTQTAKYIANYGKDLQGALRGYGGAGLADVLAAAERGGGGVSQDAVEPELRSYLASLATDDVNEFQGYGTALFKGEADYQKNLRGIDKQYAKDLMAAAVRERQARHTELEQGLLEYSAGLRSNEAMFGAQQDMLGFAQGQLGGGAAGGGGLSPAEQWIIQKESGGRTSAKNPKSSAFGLGQLILSNRQKYARALGVDPWTTNYNAQLQMMRMYIRDRYGSAENAMRFWQRNGWY